jgi:hypothetical protein
VFLMNRSAPTVFQKEITNKNCKQRQRLFSSVLI